jgi:hypothetical protein
MVTLFVFVYGQPQKIGGWKAIGQQTIAGPARAQHTWNDLAGQKYGALGTSKVLLIYYEDAFYDITPLKYCNNRIYVYLYNWFCNGNR